MVGSGQMGGGIAQVCAAAGFEIELGPHEVARLDVSPASAADELR